MIGSWCGCQIAIEAFFEQDEGLGYRIAALHLVRERSAGVLCLPIISA
jgi:hypothetical protein